MSVPRVGVASVAAFWALRALEQGARGRNSKQSEVGIPALPSFSCVMLDGLCRPSESQIQPQSLFIYMMGPSVSDLAEYLWGIRCNAPCAPPHTVPRPEQVGVGSRMAIYMFKAFYVAVNVVFVSFSPGSLNSYVCQHTHKALSLTFFFFFFFFFCLLAQSKRVGWQLPCGPSCRRGVTVARLGSREA